MSDAPSRQMRVLIVDDHELVRVGMPTLLSTDPEIEVLGETTTGAEAIAMARKNNRIWCSLTRTCPTLAALT